MKQYYPILSYSQCLLVPTLKSDLNSVSLEKPICLEEIIWVLLSQYHQDGVFLQQCRQGFLLVELQPTKHFKKSLQYNSMLEKNTKAVDIMQITSHTLTITLVLKIYDEKKTQNTSYMSRPVSRSVDTFKLGSLTKAIRATQRPMPIAAGKWKGR